MIKVNLLPVKKKKKAKPLPGFMISTLFITAAAGAILVYFIYFFNSRITERQATIKQNENEILELKKKIKAVEDYERLNTVFQQRKEIIEQLGKNKTMPVKILDELSSLLAQGVWINSMDVKGFDISLGCTAFTNTDVVNFVNNLKGSKLFEEIYLLESVQAQSGNYQTYNFRLTLKVKA